LKIVAFFTGVRELQQGKRPVVCMQQRSLEISLFFNCANPKIFSFLVRGVFKFWSMEVLQIMAGVAWIPWSDYSVYT